LQGKGKEGGREKRSHHKTSGHYPPPRKKRELREKRKKRGEGNSLPSTGGKKKKGTKGKRGRDDQSPGLFGLGKRVGEKREGGEKDFFLIRVFGGKERNRGFTKKGEKSNFSRGGGKKGGVCLGRGEGGKKGGGELYCWSPRPEKGGKGVMGKREEGGKGDRF